MIPYKRIVAAVLIMTFAIGISTSAATTAMTTGVPSGISVNQSRSTITTTFTNPYVNVSVIGNGQVPAFHWVSAASGFTFFTHILRLVEYNDSNHDGMLQNNEVVQTLLLQGNADWNMSDFASNSTTVWFNFYTSSIHDPSFSHVTINITNFLSLSNTNLKFNIQINNWPWVHTTDRLAFVFDFSSQGSNGNSCLACHTTEFNTNTTQRTTGQNATRPTGIPSNDTAGIVTTDAQGNLLGYFTSTSTATGQFGSVGVVSQMPNNGTLYVFNYPYFGNTLVHDPSLGVGTTAAVTTLAVSSTSSKTTPGMLFFTTIGALVMVGSVFAYRHRKQQ